MIHNESDINLCALRPLSLLPMKIHIFGLSHQTSPLAIREKFAFQGEQIPSVLTELMSSHDLEELVILSTCNRTEFHLVGKTIEPLTQWLCAYVNISPENLNDYFFHYENIDAVKHIMRVACGLDSMVLGEPQIFGQVKQAYQLACETGSVKKHLARLYQEVFAVAKKIRTHTSIGACPVSIASTTVRLAYKIFTDLNKANTLLIGAGETIELVAKHLSDHGVEDFIVANRTLDRAKALAEKYKGKGITIGQIPNYLTEIDLVFSCTASQLPFIGKGLVERAMQGRTKPLVMIDIAVPRDIEPEAAEVPNVHLFSIDDLKEMVQANKLNRQHAANKAEEMIAQLSEHFFHEFKNPESSATIRAYRNKVEQIRDEELSKAKGLLQKGYDPELVLYTMADTLTKRLLHTPSAELHKTVKEGHSDIIKLAKRLFGIEEIERETIHISKT